MRSAIISLLTAVKDLKAASPTMDYSPLFNQLNVLNMTNYTNPSNTEWAISFEINSKVFRLSSHNTPEYLNDPSDVDAMPSSPHQETLSEIFGPQLTSATESYARFEIFADKFMRGLQYRYADILPSADDQLEPASRSLTDATIPESDSIVENQNHAEHHQGVADELASLFVETELFETAHRIQHRNKVSNYSEIATLFKRGT